MKIIHEVTKTTTKDIITDILCNKCGNSCKAKEGPESYYGLIEKTIRGGYLSNPLQDLTSYTFSMCESCLKILFDSFKNPVETNYSEII